MSAPSQPAPSKLKIDVPKTPPSATTGLPSASPRSAPRPRPTQTPSHVRRRSLDPSDIKINSPTARRMSMSSTPQDASDTGEGWVARSLRYAEWVVAGLCAWSLLSGTLYSLLFSTALSTSVASQPLSASYFANRSNPINQYFVKLTWLHTSIVYLGHLFTSSSRQHKFRRLAMYILATAMWIGFTGFFFGRGLGDRVIEMSGGSCGLILPDGLNIKDSLVPGATIVESTEGQLLQLPNTFCQFRKPLTPLSHPELFKSLSTASQPLSALVPKWRRGFDISGHSFLMPLSAVLLTHELVPTWRRWAGISPNTGLPINHNSGRGAWGLSNTIVALFGTFVVQLWVWMLAMTGAYFHDPKEKLAGLAAGLAASALLSLTPESPFAPPSKARMQATHRRLSTIVESDENAMRRGTVVEDGIVVSPLSEKSPLESSLQGSPAIDNSMEKKVQ